MTVTPQYPTPKHVILHLSDTHLVGDGELLHDTVDSESTLIELFHGLETANIRLDAIVCTGDLTDAGRPDAYARLRGIIEPAAERAGAQLVWVMGNHDDRSAFRRVLLDEDGADPVDRVIDLDGLRLITLDSTVPGRNHGELADEQLDWLGAQLATPAPHGTLIAMHHPPIPSPLDLLALVELRDQYRLAEIVSGTDVRGILSGHLHYSTHATFAGVPVSVAAATCYTQDLTVPQPGVRGQDGGQSYQLVHVYSDRIVHSTVPIGQFPTVYELTGEAAQRLAAREDVRA